MELYLLLSPRAFMAYCRASFTFHPVDTMINTYTTELTFKGTAFGSVSVAY
jgi:hypothetical protein